MTKLSAKSRLSLFVLICFSMLPLACQNSEKRTWASSGSSSDSKNSPGASLSPGDYYANIKSDKKKQSDLDLPFRGFDFEKPITVIATGSCADQDLPQPIWKTIEKNNPNLFIFSGDTLYASKPEQRPISQQYRKLKLIPEYRSIREKVPFMAIWDDHDYGTNDGGQDNPEKDLARSEFVKHWSYLKTAVPPNQKALYHSKTFGAKKNKVQVIMLDTRWDRSPLKKVEAADGSSAYEPDTEKSKRFLSNEQWNWLEQELKKPAALRILVSSIQVLPEDHKFEKWANFPNEREKLLVLLQKSKVKNLIILSGDRHMSALAQLEVKKHGPVYEMTASGLNKTAKPGNVLTDKTYFKEGYGEPNFGLIQIDWDKKVATLQVKSLEDTVINSVDVKF